MSLTTGYQPERVDALNSHTRAAIGELSAIRSSDPAAWSAMSAVADARRNLEDHWLPLIIAIRASVAMISWTNSLLGGVADRIDQWLTFNESAADSNRFTEMTDDELLDELHGREWQQPVGPSEWPVPDAALAREVARRVQEDSDFAETILDSPTGYSMVGQMFSMADFGVDFAVAFTGLLIKSPLNEASSIWWSRQANDTGAAMTHLANTSPEAVLEMLNDQSLVDKLVPFEWEGRIPTDAIERFIVAGLYEAPASDIELLDRSYEALSMLIKTAGQHDIEPGVMRGVARSLPAHLPELAEQLETGSAETYPLRSNVDLGSYAELESFYGQVMGDPVAQALAAGHLHEYLEHVLDVQTAEDIAHYAHGDGGSHRNPALVIGAIANPTSRLVKLLFVDGIPTEQERRDMIAAAQQASNEAWIDLFFTVGSGTVPAGRAAQAIKLFVKLGKQVVGTQTAIDSDVVNDGGYRFTVPTQIEVAVIELIAQSPEARAAADLILSPAGLALVQQTARRLATASPSERTEILRDLEYLEGGDRRAVNDLVDQAVDASAADANVRRGTD